MAGGLVVLFLLTPVLFLLLALLRKLLG